MHTMPEITLDALTFIKISCKYENLAMCYFTVVLSETIFSLFLFARSVGSRDHLVNTSTLQKYLFQITWNFWFFSFFFSFFIWWKCEIRLDALVVLNRKIPFFSPILTSILCVCLHAKYEAPILTKIFHSTYHSEGPFKKIVMLMLIVTDKISVKQLIGIFSYLQDILRNVSASNLISDIVHYVQCAMYIHYTYAYIIHHAYIKWDYGENGNALWKSFE